MGQVHVFDSCFLPFHQREGHSGHSFKEMHAVVLTEKKKIKYSKITGSLKLLWKNEVLILLFNITVLLIMIGIFEMVKGIMHDFKHLIFCFQNASNGITPFFKKKKNNKGGGGEVVFIIMANTLFYLKGYSGRFLDKHERFCCCSCVFLSSYFMLKGYSAFS